MTTTTTKLHAAVAAVLADSPELGAGGFRQPGHADLAAERAALLTADGLRMVADALAFVGAAGIAHSTRSGPGRNSAGLATEAATAAGRPVTNGAVIVAGILLRAAVLRSGGESPNAWLGLRSHREHRVTGRQDTNGARQYRVTAVTTGEPEKGGDSGFTAFTGFLPRHTENSEIPSIQRQYERTETNPVNPVNPQTDPFDPNVGLWTEGEA